MPNKFKAFGLGLLCEVFSLTAPFVVPFALLFTKRDAKNLAWSWYDTPDEPELFPEWEPLSKYGWFMAAWDWFGLRNKAHGFNSLFAEEAPVYWPDNDSSFSYKDFFITRKRLGPFQFVFGYQVYASQKFATKLEYRPMLTVKYRPQ